MKDQGTVKKRRSASTRNKNVTETRCCWDAVVPAPRSAGLVDDSSPFDPSETVARPRPEICSSPAQRRRLPPWRSPPRRLPRASVHSVPSYDDDLRLAHVLADAVERVTMAR